jgi:hypothetical protein
LGVLGPTILKEAHELGNSIRPASVDISAGPLQRDGYTLLGVPCNCSAASRPVPLLDEPAWVRLGLFQLPAAPRSRIARRRLWRRGQQRRRDEQIAQAKLFAANAFKLSDDPTLSSGLPTPLRVVPYFNFAPIENAVARVKASANV